MDPTQRGVPNAGPDLQIATAIVALGRDCDAAEQLGVERRQPLSVACHEVGMAVSGAHFAQYMDRWQQSSRSAR